MPRHESLGKPVQIELSDRDWDLIMDMIENPPEPPDALKDLMKELGPWKTDAKGRTRFTLPAEEANPGAKHGKRARRSPKRG
jgi:hypothetical protein